MFLSNYVKFLGQQGYSTLVPGNQIIGPQGPSGFPGFDGLPGEPGMPGK